MAHYKIGGAAVKVTVVIVTYNDEAFIKEAIDSVLMQQANFDYKVVIIDDCSTDRTREMLLCYQRHHPETICLNLLSKNKNNNEDFAQAVLQAQSDYVALLDADDYWTSPHKLQKQVDFLDSRPDCVTCFHNVNVVYEDASIASHSFHLKRPRNHLSTTVPKPTSTLEDLVKGNFMQTGSVVFRSRLFHEIPDWYTTCLIGDWPLHILNAEHGNIGYIDEILAAYRVHSGGIWSMNMSLYRYSRDIIRIIQMYETIDRHLGYRYKKQIAESVLPLYYEVLQLLLTENNHEDAAHYAKKYLFGLSLRERVRRQYFGRQVHSLNVVLRSCVPRFNRT